MADDPNKRGKADQKRVSKQKHEIDQLAKTTGKPRKEVEAAQASTKPPMRKAVKAKLEK